VLLPLSILGVLALVVRPAWRARYGVLVAACAAVATLLIPVAAASGESFEKHVVSLVAVLAAVAAGVQVYRVGESGPRAAWDNQMTGEQAQPR
jgi:hypothetical protein